ncbi:MAG: hypothetical protein ACLPTZ_08280 [Beijerinckiaceae bacterium]
MFELSKLRSQDAPSRRALQKHPTLQQFLVIPDDWLDCLDAIPGRHAHRLMLRLMRFSWRLQSATVKVTNKIFLDCKMDRHTKLETLRRLEQAKLISVEWRPRKSPLVTILFPVAHPARRYFKP